MSSHTTSACLQPILAESCNLLCVALTYCNVNKKIKSCIAIGEKLKFKLYMATKVFELQTWC